MNRFDQYPLVGEYDVVVVGGGTAGFAAAASAARRGARTLLLEEKAYLGGTATGAQIGQLMGFADGEAGDENGVLQPGTLMYQMADVDQAAYAACTQPQRKEIALQGIAEGKLFVNNLLARPLPDTMTYCNMGRISVNPLDTRQWSEAEMDSREQIKGISDYFTAHVPGFENAHLSSTGDFTGLRDSRRILGSYVLKNQDVLEGTEFPDAIARSSYPIDIHDANGVDSIIKKPKTGVFSIPYRAMVTNEISNLILAGRCISTEYEAHACVRVMITCMRMGEAAGLAAAESIRQGVQANKLNGESLKQHLLG